MLFDMSINLCSNILLIQLIFKVKKFNFQQIMVEKKYKSKNHVSLNLSINIFLLFLKAIKHEHINII